MWDKDGNKYIDFFSGAGALNYGHNNEKMKEALIDYIMEDGVAHSLDMASEAKSKFLTKFNDVILKPRDLNYKMMFPGPTGTNTVESALKLARKATGRTDILSFTNGFHGMTIGSLSITGNSMKRKGAGMPLQNTIRSEEHTSELQSRGHLVCRLLLEKKKTSTETNRSNEE